MTTQPDNAPPPPFDTRAALILLIAILAGITIGALTILLGKPSAAAVIAGLTAAGASGKGAAALIRP
jgi:hypothetical protein